MNGVPVRLLLLEDNVGDAGLLRAALNMHARSEFVVTWVECLSQALAQVRSGHFDLVLADLDLPDSVGLATLQAILDVAPAMPVVVLTGLSDDELGRSAIRKGAQDFLVKGESSNVIIARTLRYAIERAHLKIELREANATLEYRVAQRTAELEATASALRESEARYLALTNLSSDWYWEQDAQGHFTKIFGPVMEMLGIRVDDALTISRDHSEESWNEDERKLLEANLSAKKPFLDFVYSRTNPNGTRQLLMVSGEPMFDSSGGFTGYRGIGKDVTDSMEPKQKMVRGL